MVDAVRLAVALGRRHGAGVRRRSDAGHLSLEYVVDDGASSPSIKVTTVARRRSTSTWEETAPTAGYQVKSDFLNLAARREGDARRDRGRGARFAGARRSAAERRDERREPMQRSTRKTDLHRVSGRAVARPRAPSRHGRRRASAPAAAIRSRPAAAAAGECRKEAKELLVEPTQTRDQIAKIPALAGAYRAHVGLADVRGGIRQVDPPPSRLASRLTRRFRRGQARPRDGVRRRQLLRALLDRVHARPARRTAWSAWSCRTARTRSSCG